MPVAVPDVLNAAVLVLNRVFQPVQVTSARRAFSLLVRGAALAVDEMGENLDFWSWAQLAPRHDDDVIRTVSRVLRVPRVLRVLDYDRVPRTVIHLSHRNIMLRDGFQCQYCARIPAPGELNIDHVVPRSQGGGDSWENLVTACRSCNLKKGGRTPEQSTMRLIRTPCRPRWSFVREIMLDGAERYKEWEPFLKVG
jgi:5-methylcytosine-specific restriction endonuclease McrA